MTSDYHFRLHYRPGQTLSRESLDALKKEIHALGSACLHPLPLYQVFSPDPTAFDDKIIITAHQRIGDQKRLIAFTSAVLLDLNIEGVDDPVVHGGLTVIDPSQRQHGLPVQLFARLYVDLLQRYDRKIIWSTSISELPRTLVHFYTFVKDVYPSPDLPIPSEIQLKIARTISEHHRSKMLIASSAIFEEDTFVFRGSNSAEEAKCFRKKPNDKSYLHLNKVANEFYRDRLREDMGDEVLQVGCMELEHALKGLQGERFQKYREEAEKGLFKL
ncbi:hypothetical protein F5884DRAFT_880559 [Xylogone sp. PMI_703]|nr:hypothetical protein F5884DRAFT_880559 [Xylogone sp. PMI_703]